MIEVGSREWIRATLALSLGSFLVFLNLYQTHPLLPLIAEVFSVNSLSASWTLAGCTAGLAASLLICARLADRHGRRQVMLGTLTLAILLSLLIPLVEQFSSLLLLRILQGRCWPGYQPLRLPIWGRVQQTGAALGGGGLYCRQLPRWHCRSGGRWPAGGLVWRLAAHLSGDWCYQPVAVAAGLLAAAPSDPLCGKRPRSRSICPSLAATPDQPLAGRGLSDWRPQLYGVSEPVQLPHLLAGQAPFSLPTQWLGMLFLTYLSGTVASSLSGRFANRWGAQRMLLVGIALMAIGSLWLLQGSLLGILSGLLVSSFGFSWHTPVPVPGSVIMSNTTGPSHPPSIWWPTIWEPVWVGFTCTRSGNGASWAGWSWELNWSSS